MRRGFTIVELLIFVAIFSAVMVGFVTMLVTVMRVQSRQSSANDVETQGQFLLQQLQYYVQSARLIDMALDTAATTLKLRETVASSSTDPTSITLAIGTVYLQQGISGVLQPLTSNKVTVSNLSFTRHYALGSSTAYGTDSVSFAFTMAAKASTTNAAQQYSQSFQSSAAVLVPVPKIALLQSAMGENNGSFQLKVSSTFPGANSTGSLLLAVVADSGLGVNGFITEGASFIPAGTSSIAFSQGTSTASAASATNIAATFGSNVTPADFLVAMVSNDKNITSSVSDTLGNTWIQAANQYYGFIVHDTALFYAANSAGGADTVTATFSTSTTNRSLYINEYSGVSTSSPLDATSSAINLVAPLTTTKNGDLVVGGLAAATGRITTAYPVYPYGFLSRGSSSIDNSFYEDMIQSTAGTIYINWNNQGDNPSISDTAGNTWTNIAYATYINKNAPGEIRIYAAPNAKNSANNKVTASWSGNLPSNMSIFIYEYRGASTVLSVDASSSQIQATSSAPSSGFASLPQGNVDLLFGAALYNSLIDIWSPGSGFTIESSSTVSNALAEDKAVYVASPVDASWSINNARSTLDIVVAIH